MAPKTKQPEELPDIYEGGVKVTPERWAFLQSLGTGLISVHAEEEDA